MRNNRTDLIFFLLSLLLVVLSVPANAENLRLPSSVVDYRLGLLPNTGDDIFVEFLGGSQKTWGGSDTRDGGEAYGGGGIVKNVHFDRGLQAGIRVGFRPTRSLLVSLALTHSASMVSWEGFFPAMGSASTFRGEAISTSLLTNVAIDAFRSDQLSIRPFLGLGIARNRLTEVIESDSTGGIFISKVESGKRTSPIAQIGVELNDALSPATTLTLYASATHLGEFGTGETRWRNIGVRPIKPYEINGAWQLAVGVAVSVRF